MAEHTRLERPMPTLSTTVDPRSPSYVDTRQALLARLDELDEAVAAARGRYPTVAHERVELLLDRDAPFLELCPIAGWGTESRPGAGIVGGIGRIEGVECVLLATDPPSGAASEPAAAKKAHRIGEIAAENRLPLIQLLDGAGTATAPEVLRDLARAGTLPRIAVLFGNGEQATLADYTIAVRGGPADFVAEDERDAIRLTRLCVRRVAPARPEPGGLGTQPGGPGTPPRYEVDDLLGLGSADAREILARVLDGSELDEFQPRHGAGLVAGWGELHGYPVGVLAMMPYGEAETVKAAEFVRRAGNPLVFLDNGVATDPRLVEAVATSPVPHLRVELAAGTGRAYRPRFVFRWPHSQALERSGRLHDDGVLDPRDTRTALGIALSAVHSGGLQ